MGNGQWRKCRPGRGLREGRKRAKIFFGNPESGPKDGHFGAHKRGDKWVLTAREETRELEGSKVAKKSGRELGGFGGEQRKAEQRSREMHREEERGGCRERRGEEEKRKGAPTARTRSTDRRGTPEERGQARQGPCLTTPPGAREGTDLRAGEWRFSSRIRRRRRRRRSRRR